MPFKHLEHAGGEDFNAQTKSRQAFDAEKKKSEEEREKEKEAIKEQLQKEYMKPNNEALWEEL